MTESLQMIRAEINVRDFQRWMGMRRLQDPDHAMHCLLVESFSRELAPKPFRVMTPRGVRNGCLYGYSYAGADALRDAAAMFACPLQSGIIPAGRIESKAMPTEWPTGKRLGFEVRVRPIVRPTKNADSRPRRERDAFQLEAERYDKGEMPRSREQVYSEWLVKQLDTRGGARLESAMLQSFQRTRVIRKRHSRYSEGPDALMRGNLVITNGDAFAKLLAQGVGRHRAYGYGMLLLRPAH
ncbi:MAG: type I-E CRISPR-associated protein Cas6/Cse3/CasE [Chloroflexi bacterium]|nr:type I-E CRISPR-associated protein Cas6/Cse3/CasE [Chloroflexota bacterium]